MVMENFESFERFEQGLLRCASCCRELAQMLDAQEWKELSRELLLLLNKGRAIYNAVPLTELEIMNLTTQMEIAQHIACSQNRAVN